MFLAYFEVTGSTLKEQNLKMMWKRRGRIHLSLCYSIVVNVRNIGQSEKIDRDLS